MGMDAVVDIWVGINFDDDVDYYNEILPKLPAEFKNTNGDYNDGLDLDGFYIQEIYAGGDELVGFGIIIFHHDWDYGTITFSLSEISNKKDNATVVLEQLFNEWGIDQEIIQEIDMYIQTDYR